MMPINYLTDDLNDMNVNFIHLLDCFNLSQWNDTPNSIGKYLDLILCDIEHKKLQPVLPSLELCEPVDVFHPPLQLDIDVSPPEFLPVNEPLKFNY